MTLNFVGSGIGDAFVFKAQNTQFFGIFRKHGRIKKKAIPLEMALKNLI